ncbi:MAG: hypothetical protein M3P18_19125, partial [Actinomycetota bacterium]|nr:hypothetical protein [Actinomycetota bacterium]
MKSTLPRKCLSVATVLATLLSLNLLHASPALAAGNCGNAKKLVFTVGPSNTAAGSTISPSIQVAIQTTSGGSTTCTENVALAIGTNPSSGTLSGTTTVAASATTGIATFSNLSINKAGNGYTLTASAPNDGTLTPATSGTFTISAGTASRVAFSVQPSNTTAGATITPAVKVEVRDANGNLVTGSSASVTLAIGT